MRIAVDYDGTVVEQGSYDLSEPSLRYGARAGLWALRAAGHQLTLYSARANRALRFHPSWDPLVRAGHLAMPDAWVRQPQHDLAEARYWQMVRHVDLELPGVFAAVDDGLQGKPVCDLIIDNVSYGAGPVDWDKVRHELGQSWRQLAVHQPRAFVAEAPNLPLPEIVEGDNYTDVLAGPAQMAVVRGMGVREVGDLAHPFRGPSPIGWTRLGPILAVDLGPDDAVARVAVIAGQHGEEQAGVAAVCNRWAELEQLARAWKVHVRAYPCVNPEGYERMQRYNDRRQEPTNAALEYEVLPGEWRGEVDPGERWLSTRRCAAASDESRWLVNDIARFKPHVVLDLHGDSDVPAGGAFAYVFGERAPYAEGMRRSGAVPYAYARLRNRSWTDAAPLLKTDEDGLCSFHDGSVTAWAWLCGARLSACVETSFKGPFAEAEAIAWGWIQWAVIAGSGARGLSSGNMHPMPEDLGAVVPFFASTSPI